MRGKPPAQKRDHAWPTLEEVEERYIHEVMEAVGNNITQAAEILGIDRRTLYRKLERKNPEPSA